MKIHFNSFHLSLILLSNINASLAMEIPADPFDPENNKFESQVEQIKIPEMGHPDFFMPEGFIEEARINAEQIREEDARAAVTRTPSPILKTLEYPQIEMGESLQKFAEHLRSHGIDQISPAPKTELPLRADIVEFQTSADSLKNTVEESYSTFNAGFQGLHSEQISSRRWSKMENFIKAINAGSNHLHTFFATSTCRGEYRYSPAAIHLFLSVDSIKKLLNQEPSNNKLKEHHPAYHYVTSIKVLHHLLERNVDTLPNEEKTSK